MKERSYIFVSIVLGIIYSVGSFYLFRLAGKLFLDIASTEAMPIKALMLLGGCAAVLFATSLTIAVYFIIRLFIIIFRNK